jgi:DNA polymerase-3 subunit epsilon
MSQSLAWLTPDANGTFIAAALDTETSGLSSDTDHIIEVGVRLFRFELPTGRIVEKLESHSSLQDPGFPISLEIQSVTGITPSMLVGQKIDWDQVDAMLARADVILAHNAQFDRGFVDRKSQVSPSKVWGCSAWQVDWRAKGFKNARLQDLCGALGIVYQAHRAMSDVEAMVQLLGMEDVFTAKPYLLEILTSARQEMSYLWVEGKTYDQRDLLKAQGFRWNAARKFWGKLVPVADAAQQVESVQSLIPGTQVQSQPVGVIDRFKTQV